MFRLVSVIPDLRRLAHTRMDSEAALEAINLLADGVVSAVAAGQEMITQPWPPLVYTGINLLRIMLDSGVTPTTQVAFIEGLELVARRCAPHSS